MAFGRLTFSQLVRHPLLVFLLGCSLLVFAGLLYYTACCVAFTG
ncbi:hypothetical protein [Bacillus mobilis]